MTIRTFAAGDDLAQVSIFNEAAADLPKFKPATVDEVRRRCRAPDFDPTTRFFALANNRPVAYATFAVGGRVSYPWCRKGHEDQAGPLLERVLQEMRQRRLPSAWAAYRADWQPPREFFLANGFAQAREVVNWVLDLADMPTPAARPQLAIAPVTPADLPALFALAPGILRVRTAEELGQHLLANKYFNPDAAFVLRNRAQGQPVGLGIVVTNPAYAHPRQVDAQMPCFRLGAFATEGLTTKRLNGLFSILLPDTRDVTPQGLDMLGYAAQRLGETDVETLAAQVPSDVPHLLRFYKQYFRRQGSFPIYERALM